MAYCGSGIFSFSPKSLLKTAAKKKAKAHKTRSTILNIFWMQSTYASEGSQPSCWFLEGLCDHAPP